METDTTGQCGRPEARPTTGGEPAVPLGVSAPVLAAVLGIVFFGGFVKGVGALGLLTVIGVRLTAAGL